MEMKDSRKATETADERMQIIAPLLVPNQSRRETAELKEKLSKDYGISVRTIGRYLASYTSGGFEALKPQGKNNNSKYKIPEHIVQEAIQLRREQQRFRAISYTTELECGAD